MKNTLKTILIAAVFALPISGAHADDLNICNPSEHNCALTDHMTDMQKNMEDTSARMQAMDSHMQQMMQKMSDPGMKQEMADMRKEMDALMQHMQQMHQKMGDMKNMVPGPMQDKTGAEKNPADKDAEHQIHHPAL